MKKRLNSQEIQALHRDTRRCLAALAENCLDSAASQWLIRHRDGVVQLISELKAKGVPLPWIQHASQAMVDAALRHQELVPVLLQCQANPVHNKSAALVNASRVAEAATVTLLVNAGADPNAKDGLVLTEGVKLNLVKVVDTLLMAGADPTMRDSEAMIIAAAAGYTKILRRLLDAGANPRAANGVALTRAAASASRDCVELLLARGNFSLPELIKAEDGASPSCARLIKAAISRSRSDRAVA